MSPARPRASGADLHRAIQLRRQHHDLILALLLTGGGEQRHRLAMAAHRTGARHTVVANGMERHWTDVQCRKRPHGLRQCGRTDDRAAVQWPHTLHATVFTTANVVVKKKILTTMRWPATHRDSPIGAIIGHHVEAGVLHVG